MAVDPVVIFTAPVLEQVEKADPAEAVAAGFIVIVRVDIPAQLPTVFVVNLSVTEPL